METWKAVAGFEGIYEVSDIGRIKRITNRTSAITSRTIEHILKPFKMDSGYVRVVLNGNCKCRGTLVHRAVLAAFVGPAPTGFQVNHKNGKKDDNRLENLEYVTPSGNQLHSYRVLRRTTPRAKLTSAQVLTIRELRKCGLQFKEIAMRFGVSRKTCSDIIYGKTWCSV